MEIDHVIRGVSILLLSASLFSIFFHFGRGWYEKGKEIEEAKRRAREEPLYVEPAPVIRRTTPSSREKPLKVRFEGPLDKNEIRTLIADAAPSSDASDAHLTGWRPLTSRGRRYRN